MDLTGVGHLYATIATAGAAVVFAYQRPTQTRMRDTILTVMAVRVIIAVGNGIYKTYSEQASYGSATGFRKKYIEPAALQICLQAAISVAIGCIAASLANAIEPRLAARAEGYKVYNEKMREVWGKVKEVYKGLREASHAYDETYSKALRELQSQTKR